MAVDIESMAERFKRVLDSMTPEEIDKITADWKAHRTPPGWHSIEDKLPMMMAEDICTGTTYKVRYKDGSEGTSLVGDHNTWYYTAKEAGITHWLQE